MQQNQQPVSVGNPLITCAFVLSAVAMKYGFTSDPRWYQLAYISIPMVLIGAFAFRTKEGRR